MIESQEREAWFEGLIRLVAPRHCVGCEDVVSTAFCDCCETLVERSDGEGAVFRYGGPIADAIQRFKYDRRSDLGVRLGRLMVDKALGNRGCVDAVVPVPLHWRRRRSRGFDQAALLAVPIAKALGVPVRVRGLRRVRHTPSQVRLPHAARQRNVAGAFAPRRLCGAKRVLLVDDVRTTGATLASAASALRSAGVSDVRSLVLATRVLREGT